MVQFRQQTWEVIYPGKITLKFLREHLFSSSKAQYIHEAYVATHDNGENTHTHCGISLGKRPLYTEKSCYTAFTLKGIKPNKVSPLKIGKGTQGKMDIYYRYCMNEDKHPGETITEPSCYKFTPKDESEYESAKPKVKLTASAVILQGYVENNQSLYDQYEAADWNQKAYITMNYEKLSGMLTAHRRMMQENKPPEFPIESFKESKVKTQVVDHDFSKREVGEKKRCLVLQGESNLGKTKLAKARFKKPLVVRHMDKLKVFDPLRHDGIIFDDMSFSHYPRECVLALMDMDDDADINVKNSMVTIPAGFPRIFCTNREMYASNWEGYDKSNSFLPKPITKASSTEPGPTILPMESVANGVNGVNDNVDQALMNRFILIKVTAKLYA